MIRDGWTGGHLDNSASKNGLLVLGMNLDDTVEFMIKWWYKIESVNSCKLSASDTDIL